MFSILGRFVSILVNIVGILERQNKHLFSSAAAKSHGICHMSASSCPSILHVTGGQRDNKYLSIYGFSVWISRE